MKKKTLLIDGDLILFRNCVAVEKDVRWSDDYHMLYSSFSDAWTNIELDLLRLFERFETEKHVIALSEGRNFRYDIEPTYKGNRAGSRKPLCYARCIEQLREQYKVYSFPGIEADDVLGIFGTRDADTIICSADKDMRTLPATVFDGKQVRTYSVPEADLNFYTQVLTGDTADGYPGCPGVGPVKAAALLDAAIRDSRVPWLVVVAAYEKAGLTEADAIKQARLARILRASDWDAKNKKPILWSPTI